MFDPLKYLGNERKKKTALNLQYFLEFNLKSLLPTGIKTIKVFEILSKRETFFVVRVLECNVH